LVKNSNPLASIACPREDEKSSIDCKPMLIIMFVSLSMPVGCTRAVQD
jgi:hypothetical protein